ncbi:MAG: hypothetical protein GF392_02035 [Candidatus Omnitrophica bacterium]|nr:hypothetical protein [Candidatus Omnitrophota bacterium]
MTVTDLKAGQKKLIVFLSVMVLAGSLILYVRHSRPLADIKVINGQADQEVPMEKVLRDIREQGRVNVNTATMKELTAVPGIGERTYARISEYRAQHGDFETLEDLVNIKGIGSKKLEKMRPYLKTR